MLRIFPSFAPLFRQARPHKAICNRHLLLLPLSGGLNTRLRRRFSTHQSFPPPNPPAKPSSKENIYTLPNLLTVSRITACPILGWSILQGDFHLATALLVYAGLTDLVSLSLRKHELNDSEVFWKADGYLARRYNMTSVLGTILDPAADKTLMTTLTVTLAWQGLLPCMSFELYILPFASQASKFL